MERFRNKTVVITGASRGIGAAIAKRFAEEGANLVVGYFSERGKAEKIAKLANAHGGKGKAIPVDVKSPARVKKFFELLAVDFPRFDVLVNNAGVLSRGGLQDARVDEWDETFAVNVRGVFLCCKFGLDYLGGKRGGVIINIASRLAHTGAPNSLAYGASKAAVVNITKALAKHLAPGVRVNAVAPAYTLTEMTAQEPEQVRENFKAGTPMRRLASTQDTAGAVTFPASEDAAYITGHTLLVDGGNSL